MSFLTMVLNWIWERIPVLNNIYPIEPVTNGTTNDEQARVNMTNESPPDETNELGPMKSFCENLVTHRLRDEDEIITNLADCLDNGGNIDTVFRYCRIFNGIDLYVTILSYSIIQGYEQVLEYVLSRGASMLNPIFSRSMKHTLFNTAYDFAIETSHITQSDAIIRILKKRSLELYSSFGLTALHLECANRRSKIWNEETEKCLETAAISAESPFWPGMTPFLIAAKFRNTDLVKRLLDLGADPFDRDHEEKTPLFHLDVNDFCDARLWSPDGREMFDSSKGQTYFHVACQRCPVTLDIVKRYLDQGISPDLPMLSKGKENKIGLHIAAEIGSLELLRLLIEYGAKVDKLDFSSIEDYLTYGFGELMTWRANIFPYRKSMDTLTEFICLLIESGLNLDRNNISALQNCITYYSNNIVRDRFFSCIVKLSTLNEHVSPGLKIIYRGMSQKKLRGWTETEYARKCSQELRSLSKLGLRQILDDTVIVKPDFKTKFGCLHLSDYEAFPIYGEMLRMKTKRKLLVELKEKKRLIQQAITQVQWLFQEKVQLPDLCAETILWNFSIEELNKFIAENV